MAPSPVPSPVATPELTRYAFWRSSATLRVRVALKLKHLSARDTFINMDAPTTQSLAILEFLEETQAQPPLLPADRHGRARLVGRDA
jgi:hypothetical protein